ncbi:unnamed protein product [Malus baccata var. baccata]
MKGGVAGGSYSGKRRWKGLVIGVLGLVFLSMLVPLLFLLGLHNGFHHPGYTKQYFMSVPFATMNKPMLFTTMNKPVSFTTMNKPVWFTTTNKPVSSTTMNNQKAC